MKITFTITEEDFINFHMNHLKLSPYAKRKFLMVKYGILLFLIGLIILTDFNHNNQFDLSSYLPYNPLVLLALIWFFFVGRFERWERKRTLKKLLSEGKNKGLLGEQTIEFDANTTTITDCLETTSFTNSLIEKCIEIDDYIYLYKSSVSAYVIPKKFLTSEEISEIKKIFEYAK